MIMGKRIAFAAVFFASGNTQQIKFLRLKIFYIKLILINKRKLQVYGRKKMDEIRKKFDVDSWHLLFAACILVWMFSCSGRCSAFITARKSEFVLFVIGCYILLCFYILLVRKKRDSKTILFLVLTGGFLLRACYVLATPYNITKHDIGSFMGFHTGEWGTGHLGYIEYLCKNRRFIDFDARERWGFYHPPGFYIVESVILQITRLFCADEILSYESLQITTLFFSSLTIWTVCRILKEFSISDRWLILLAAFLSVHPFFSIMAVTVTNDCMTMYLMSLALWYTIRWHKSSHVKDIAVIALALGLAMFTKLNAVIAAFGIGIVFLCVFWKKRGEYRRILGQFFLFLLICASIGLFYPVRNRIKFDMPLTYIQSVDPGGSDFSSEVSVVSRVGVPNLRQMSYAFPSFDRKIEWNIWIQLLRTSLFDELMPDVGDSLFEWYAMALFQISILLAVVMNVLFAWCIFNKDTMCMEMKLLLLVGYAAMLLGYTKFCMDESFFCTMNYRYIPISMFFPCIATAVWSRNGSIVFRNILSCLFLTFILLAAVINLYFIAWSGTPL